MKLVITKRVPKFQSNSARQQVYNRVVRAGANGASIDKLHDAFDGASAAIWYLLRAKFVRVVH